MPRPSLRAQRRREFARAFAHVPAEHGQSAATIAAVAAKMGVNPGLLHHDYPA